jgi:hypothetical protein
LRIPELDRFTLEYFSFFHKFTLKKTKRLNHEPISDFGEKTFALFFAITLE